MKLGLVMSTKMGILEMRWKIRETVSQPLAKWALVSKVWTSKVFPLL
jgi:hypothetical protein